jgi:hypothetical protein
MFYKVCFIFNYFWHFGFLVFYCLVIYCLVFYTQWSKEKVQKDKQRLTKHTYKTKDRATRTPLKTGCEFRCSGRVGSSCSTSGTRRVNLVTNPVISRDVCHACSMRSLVFKAFWSSLSQFYVRVDDIWSFGFFSSFNLIFHLCCFVYRGCVLH